MDVFYRPYLGKFFFFFSKFSKTIVRFILDEELIKILIIIFFSRKVWRSKSYKVIFYPYLTRDIFLFSKIFNRIRRV